MEPIPETAEALGSTVFHDTDLLARLEEHSARVRALVPDCVGLSVALVESGLSFTLVATDTEIAVLDAIQYLFGGPCVDAADSDQVTIFEHDDTDDSSLDEKGWHRFARATAAHGVASTLTIPMTEGEQVVGTVNLYASSAQAFTGLHTEIADIFGAWSPGAVTNADLSFRTRDLSQHAPQQLRDDATVQVAVELIASGGDLSVDEARHALREAARRAGTSEVSLARTIIELTGDVDPDT